MRHAIVAALICLTGAACAQALTPAELEARGVTFYAPYDEGVSATYARGNPEPTNLVNARLVEGKVGQAVLTQRDKERELGKLEGRATSLNYDARGHLFGERGTVSYWVQPLYDADDPEIRSDSGSTGPYLVNVSSVEDTYYQQFIRTNIKGGAFYFWLVDRDGKWRGPSYTEGINTWKSGDWHHVVMTWDASQGMRFYDNGAPKYSTWGEDAFPPATPLGIGVGGTAPTARPGWTRAADSVYDELVMLDRAVTDEEVLALMEGRLGDLQASDAFAYSDEQLDDRRRGFLIEDDPNRVVITGVATIECLQPTQIDLRYITAEHFADGRFEPTVRFEQGGVVMPREATFTLADDTPANYAVIVGRPPEGEVFGFAAQQLSPQTTAAGAARVALPDVARPALAIPGSATVGETQFFRVTEGHMTAEMSTWTLGAEGSAQDLASPRMAPEGLEAPQEDYAEIVAHITDQAAPLLAKLDPDDRRLLIPGDGAPALEVGATRHLYLAGEVMREDSAVSTLRVNVPLTSDADAAVFRLNVPHPYEPTAFYATADVQVNWQAAGERTLELVVRAPGMIFPQGSRLLLELVSSEDFTLVGAPKLSADIIPAADEGEAFARQYNRFVNEEFTSRMGVNFVWYLRGIDRDNALTRGLFRALYFDPDNKLAWDMAHWAKLRPWPAFTEQPDGPEDFPLMAKYAREAAKSARDAIQWWIDERQDESGYMVGRADMWNDDTKLFNEYSFLWLLSGDEQLAAAMEKYLAAHWASGRMVHGWSEPYTDAVHSAEEASYLEPTMALVRYGDPLHIEQIMETASNIDYWTGITGPGHRHFRSNFFTADEMKTEGHFGHDVGLDATAMVSSMWLAWYNGHPVASRQMTEWMQAWVEDTMTEAPNKPAGAIPSYVDFATHELGPDEEVYLTEIAMMMDAAWQLTGEERFVQPLLGYIQRKHPHWMQVLNMAAPDLYRGVGPGEIDELLLAGADERMARIASDDFFQRGIYYEEIPGILGWMVNGDEAYLEATCLNAWRNNARALPLYTQVDAHKDRVYPWSRYVLPWMYCGGNALNGRGSAPWPTLAVSWNAGYDFAALVRENAPERLRVSAWNFGDARQVGMRTWGLQPGTWRVTVDGGEAREAHVERGATVPIDLPARGEAEIVLELVAADDWSPQRADLALSATEGARIDGGALTVIAHNVGSADAPACTATLSADGAVIAEAQVPAIAAPLDFLPKTAEVSFAVPAGLAGDLIVTLDAGDAVPEITELNNTLSVRPN